jgi:hypothetical protein
MDNERRPPQSPTSKVLRGFVEKPDSRPVRTKRPQKTLAQSQKLAKLLKAGTPVCKALLDAGYSETQARKGRRAIPKKVLRMLTPKVKKLLDLGNIDPHTQENLARGRLALNTIEGKDGGSMSAKILGSDRRVNMWQPDIQQGLIIITPPQSVLENKAKLLKSDE